MTKPVLVIIPGIGDRTRVYGVFAWVWRRLGYETHVISFGWSNYYADIGTKTRDFLHKLDAVTAKADCYVIGVSAGGTAAVHAYANRGSIRRVVTISAPFADFENLQNRLLADSIIAARQDLRGFDAVEKARIMSVFGLYDQTVPTHMSRPDGVRLKHLWTLWHGPTIFVALTLRARRLKRFFSKGR